MKKKILLVVMMVAMSLGVVACGGPKAEEKPEVEDIQEDVEVEEDAAAEDTSGASDIEITDGITIDVESNDASGIRAAYSKLVKDMKDYVAGCELLDQEYTTYDYMYFDYDEDGTKEIVLYLGYYDSDVYYRDVVFTNYFEESQQVGILATNHAELNDASFYCEYDGKMARYSWTTDPMESYLYTVSVNDGCLAYVLEKGYDEIVADLEKEGMHPLSLYGDWEIILPEE